MFFTFYQNNSGGVFDFEEGRFSHYVIIEAETEEKAIERAKEVGLYFDGVGDCNCCGNRWSYPWDDGTDVPRVYGKLITEPHKSHHRFMEAGKPEGYIHYLDPNRDVEPFDLLLGA